MEINIGDTQLNPVALVNPIVYSELAYSTIIPEENNLEINLFIEKVQSVDVPSMINPVVFASMVETAGIDEDLEISFAIDEVLAAENETILIANATTPEDQTKRTIACERNGIKQIKCRAK